jgi:hypothetical protein
MASLASKVQRSPLFLQTDQTRLGLRSPDLEPQHQPQLTTTQRPPPHGLDGKQSVKEFHLSEDRQ